MNKHTPGPWFYIKGDEWSHSVVTHHGELPGGMPSYWTVASINKQREPKHEANARLIAAAPELLAVAEKIKAHGTISSAWVDELDAAIAKATGEAA